MNDSQNHTLGPKIAEGRTAEVFAWGKGQVLKLYRESWPRPRQVAEFERRQALASQRTGYRVPIVGEIIEIDDRIGIIYQRVKGETMLDAIQRNLPGFFSYTRQMTDLHLEMHNCGAAGLESIQDRLAGKIVRATRLKTHTKDCILQHLFSLPADTKLLHGDFHPGNIMLTPEGPVIIDWIDATFGHPLADVARTTIITRFGIPPEERISRMIFGWMGRLYLHQYFRHSTYSREELEDWLLPVAAARLSEKIPHEVEPLLAYVQQMVEKLVN